MNRMMNAPANDKVRQLVSHLQADTRSASEIGRLSGVSQPTVSRMRSLARERMRMSTSFNKICSFYGISASMADEDARRYNELLRTAIVDAWDGTEPHGRALLQVIKGLKELQGAPRNAAGE
jgi:hypothetical protein